MLQIWKERMAQSSGEEVFSSEKVDESVEESNSMTKPSNGDDGEFVKVSRIASIQVNNTKTEGDFYAAKKVKTESVSKSESRPVKVPVIRKTKKTKGREADDDDSVKIPKWQPMDYIEISPYENISNAEIDMKLFEDLHDLLEEPLQSKAAEMFGSKNARSLVKAHALIDQCGIVYSQEWVDGNIKGTMIGDLPKHLLLLCLVSNRFTKVDEFLLAGLARDMQIVKIVKEAVEVWGLDDEYKKISGTADNLKNFSFVGKRRQCFKCEIFVARTYSCYKAFGLKGELEKPLLSKVRRCLDIMESRLAEPKGSTKKKRKLSTETSVQVTPTGEDPPVKRKRGRPPKNKNLSPAPSPKSVKEEAWESGGTSSKPGRKKSKPLSLEDLLATFEAQHEELGRKYSEMGKTLSKIKAKIEEERLSSEEDMLFARG